MAELSPFKAQYGIRQGRIQPSVFPPADGAYAFVFGSELPGRSSFTLGDFVQIEQALDLTGIKTLSFALAVKIPPDLPVSRNISSGTSLLRGNVISYGDDLSAIVVPSRLSASDAGRPVRITGASNPQNNFVNYLSSVISPTTAILRHPIKWQPAGFSATLLGLRWVFLMYIEGAAVLECTFARGNQWSSNDFKVNVSQIAGLRAVAARIELREAV